MYAPCPGGGWLGHNGHDVSPPDRRVRQRSWLAVRATPAHTSTRWRSWPEVLLEVLAGGPTTLRRWNNKERLLS